MNETSASHTVLIVDDEKEIRDSIAKYFTKRGFAALTACGAWEAIEIIKLLPVSFVISDVRMPEGDGYELAQLINEWETEKEKPSFVFVTGYTEIKEGDLLNAGGVKVFYKPLVRDYLYKFVKKELGII